MSQPENSARKERPRSNDRPTHREERARIDAVMVSEAPPSPPPPAPAPPGPTAMHALFDERERSIDAHHRIQRFFLALDRRTDPRTADVALRQPMRDLMRAYDERQSYRVYYASVGRGIDLRLPAPSVLDTARKVSAIFVECAPILAGHPWDLGELAFELFAAGRLVTAHPEPALQEELCMHGAPDGWNFFQFAEHAFTCVDAGIDAAHWDPLLQGLVAASDVLAHHGHGPLDRHLPSEERSRRFAQRDGRVVPMAEVQRVREACRARIRGAGDVERRRRLADLFAHALAAAGFGRFSTVFRPPGTLRPLLEPRALGDA